MGKSSVVTLLWLVSLVSSAPVDWGPSRITSHVWTPKTPATSQHVYLETAVLDHEKQGPSSSSSSRSLQSLVTTEAASPRIRKGPPKLMMRRAQERVLRAKRAEFRPQSNSEGLSAENRTVLRKVENMWRPTLPWKPFRSMARVEELDKLPDDRFTQCVVRRMLQHCSGQTQWSPAKKAEVNADIHRMYGPKANSLVGKLHPRWRGDGEIKLRQKTRQRIAAIEDPDEREKALQTHFRNAYVGRMRDRRKRERKRGNAADVDAGPATTSSATSTAPTDRN